MQANNQQLQQVTEKWIAGVIKDRGESVRTYSFKDLNSKTYEFSGVPVFDQKYVGETLHDEDNNIVQRPGTRFQWFATETGRMVMVSSIDTGNQYVDFFDAKDADAGWGGLIKKPMEELRERFFKSWMMSKMHQMGVVDILQGYSKILRRCIWQLI